MRSWVPLLCCLAACGGDDPEPGPTVACSSDIDCSGEASCRSGRCIANGSLGDGEVCSKQKQCGEGLVCDAQRCKKTDCNHFYQVDECSAGSYCAPVPGSDKGLCVEAECGSGTSATCVNDSDCVFLASGVGVCFPECVYGFVGSTYQDDCTDAEGIDLACQPLGIGNAPVCLASGTLEIGEPGCDMIAAPCVPGAACVDIVCRKICRDSQEDPCALGEVCAEASPGSALSYCQAP